MRASEITKKIENMFAFRGYGEVRVKNVGQYVVVSGKGKRRSAVALIDLNEKYAGKFVSAAISQLIKEAESAQLNDIDSIIFVHAFKNTSQRLAKVAEIARDVRFYFETFQFFDFIIDHDQPHSTRDWSIVDNADFIRDKSIDRPPQIYIGDIMIRYLGARVGEYVKYIATNVCEVGPFSHEILVQVTSEAVGTEEAREGDV